MFIVDAHLHLWEKVDGFVFGTMRTSNNRYGKITYTGEDGKTEVARWMPPAFVDSSARAELLLEYMDWAGVDKAVLMQGPCYGDQNAYYAELRNRYPDKFIFAFAFVDPRYPEKAIRDLDVAIKSYGLNGVKFEPNHTPFWLDDPALKPVWDQIAQLEIVVAIDLGWNPQNEYNMQNDRVEKVIAQYPETAFVLLHFGGSDLGNPTQIYPFSALQKTLELRKYPNVYFEAGGLVMMGEEDEYPYERVQDMIRAVWEKVGSDRIFWGSDWPYTNQCCTYPQNVDVLRKHCKFLPTEDKSKILGGSAMAFYGERGRR